MQARQGKFCVGAEQGTNETFFSCERKEKHDNLCRSVLKSHAKAILLCVLKKVKCMHWKCLQKTEEEQAP